MGGLLPAGDVLPSPGDGDAVGPGGGGVVLEPIDPVPQIFPLTGFLQTLCRRVKTVTNIWLQQ